MYRHIAQNLAAVKGEITAALAKSGRPADSCSLLVVTKQRSAEEIAALIQTGHTRLGENRVQELRKKIPLYPDACWDMIGHMQTNKIKYIAGAVSLIHSVDSLRLLLAIEKECRKRDVTQDVLLEVNIAQEAAKYGLRKQDVAPLLEEAAACTRVRVRGLMTMAPFVADAETVRPVFRELRELAHTISSKAPTAWTNTLSMGMSNDFTVAVEEGATIVRVGTRIFQQKE